MSGALPEVGELFATLVTATGLGVTSVDRTATEVGAAVVAGTCVATAVLTPFAVGASVVAGAAVVAADVLTDAVGTSAVGAGAAVWPVAGDVATCVAPLAPVTLTTAAVS